MIFNENKTCLLVSESLRKNGKTYTNNSYVVHVQAQNACSFFKTLCDTDQDSVIRKMAWSACEMHMLLWSSVFAYVESHILLGDALLIANIR